MLLGAVWGAPTHPVHYVGLLSSLLLLVSAFVCLFKPVTGRILAAVSILGIGIFFIPSSASLVPSPNTIIPPIAYILLVGYFALLAFGLFFPRPWRWSILLFVGCLFASAAFAATTYFHRVDEGKLQFPPLVSFRWIPTADPLDVKYDPDHWITPEARQLLADHGITGTLSWSGTQGHSDQSRRLIVICSSRIPSPKKLYHPRKGTIFYIFDGATWKTVPEQASVYSAYATLQPDGTLEQVLPDGGAQGSRAFPWQ
jgi:hypothetical protein